jgi:hypothetical protein
VYENKGPDDNFPDTKDDISTQLHGSLRERYAPFAETTGSFVIIRALGVT